MSVSTGKFLEYLTSRWGRDIPLKMLWEIKFNNLQYIARSVSNILQSTERVGQAGIWPVVNFFGDQDREQGLFVAQSVVMPQDTFSTGTTDVTNYGGLRAGVYAGDRTPYGTINIEFLETNTDIIDHLFRPWIIAASHKGLIEDGDRNTNIKTDLFVNLYSRASNGGSNNPQWKIRKTFLFEGVTPVNVEGDKLSYGQMTGNSITKSVSFVFKNYKMLPGPDIKSVYGNTVSTPTNRYEVINTIVTEAQAAEQRDRQTLAAVETTKTSELTNPLESVKPLEIPTPRDTQETYDQRRDRLNQYDGANERTNPAVIPATIGKPNGLLEGVPVIKGGPDLPIPKVENKFQGVFG